LHEGQDGPWFVRYPKELRAEVARRVVRGWEREVGVGGA
jgi:hypothetical protein